VTILEKIGDISYDIYVWSLKKEREETLSIFFTTVIDHHFPIYAQSNFPLS